MVFTSQIIPSSDSFEANRNDMLALVGKLRELEARPGALSEKRRDRFQERGQIMPRERLAHLLDPGMPVLYLHTLVGYVGDIEGQPPSVPGASVILAIGFVQGVRCMIWVDDSGIKAGAITAMTLPAVLSIQKLARRQKLPLVHLVESAGANLLDYKVETWAEGGAVFYNLARLGAAGIPTVAVLHGPSTAGGAYMPGLSDYVVGVKKAGMAALAGSALVYAATGETADDRDLGGSEMHASVTGLVEYLADDDAAAIQMARSVIGSLNWNERLPVRSQRVFAEPLHSPDELAGVVPIDYKTGYDVREVALRVVDAPGFDEFKPGYGGSTVCLYANVFGITCGLIGNNGPIDPDGATKAAQFLQLCDQAEKPVVFLHNTTGFLVGTEYEQAGMIKHGSKMIQAVANIRVPKIAFYVGASFGAGNYGMGGYAYEPDFVLSWPNALTGVMGGEQAATTMATVARAVAQRVGKDVDEAALEKQHRAISRHFDQQSDAFYTSGRGLDHGVIDPRDTRKVLGFCLETCLEARARPLNPNTFGVARM
ncbi:MAG: acyl-CoA carboxylase subunit beta [Rhodobacteraceae bacterium]|nr:acyl-CoA carboxylase subunit beta [Paracoccaceae bacterium]